MARRNVDDQIREQEERLRQLKAKAAQLAAREKAAMKAKARQDETRRKIQHGGLVALAGLADIDKAVLLGVLLNFADRLHDDDHEAFVAAAKARGALVLTEQASSNQKSAAAQTQD